MKTFDKVVEVATPVVLYLLLYMALLGFPTMVLWNWLIPQIFGLPKIDTLQAMGLLILGNTLFSGTNVYSKK